MTGDPYDPPAADPTPASASDPTGTPGAPPVVVEHLVHTRPWVKFCSLAGYVASVFFIAIGCFSLLGMMRQSSLLDKLLLGGSYMIMAILFFIPSIWLSVYAKSITRLQLSNRIEDLEQAIAYQRSFWRQIALMILIILSIYVVSIAFAAIVLLSSH